MTKDETEPAQPCRGVHAVQSGKNQGTRDTHVKTAGKDHVVIRGIVITVAADWWRRPDGQERFLRVPDSSLVPQAPSAGTADEYLSVVPMHVELSALTSQNGFSRTSARIGQCARDRLHNGRARARVFVSVCAHPLSCLACHSTVRN
jgi:hypothetical protein